MKTPMKKMLSLLLIASMVLSTTATGFADELPAGDEGEPAAVEETVEKAPEEEKQKEEPKQEKAAPEPEKEEEPVQQESQPVLEEKEPAESKTEKKATETKEDSPKRKLKLDASLSDGTYDPEDFKFVGGTGKAYLTCESVIIKDGQPYAVFKASADTLTHIYLGKSPSADEYTPLYDPDTKTCGEDVFPINSLKVAVKVTLNTTVDCALRTTAMTQPHWVNYTYNITLSDSAEKVSDDTTIPEFEPSDDEGDGKDDEEEKEPDKKDTKTLKDGTYEVNATTDRKMFYLYPKEKNPAKVILVKKNGKMTATITLTGDGYDYVYMGTPAQAKKAGKKNWIKFKKVKGYYTFKIPVSKLDKKLPITPHSKKYESDGDPKTDPWRPDKWIMFYSKGAKKVKDGTTIDTKGKANSRNSGNSKKAAKQTTVSAAKGTSAVNNSTGLKDGTYKPDRFNWSGGSGRLAYIRCTKITVKGGKAYATIEFSSSKYDSLKASGHTYSKSGGGNSKFTIPVKLNANNTIIGRTTAMSQPHWVQYSIFIYKKGAGAGGKNAGSSTGDSGHLTSTKKLSDEAPDLMGLEFKEKVDVKYAKLFNIYKYEQGITLIEVDQTRKTALYEKESGKKSDKKENAAEEAVEYDEDGKPIAKSQNEITDELYHNNIVNYLVVPDGAEVPAGLEKDCVIIQQPVESGYIASQKVLDELEDLGALDAVKSLALEADEIENEDLKKAVEEEKVNALGSYEKPDYATLIKSETDLAIFPGDVLPEVVKDENDAEAKEESDKKKEALTIYWRRFSALAVPMMIDRSDDEASNYAEAEWIKVYGAVFGQEDKAGEIFDKFVKEVKKKAKDDQ